MQHIILEESIIRFFADKEDTDRFYYLKELKPQILMLRVRLKSFGFDAGDTVKVIFTDYMKISGNTVKVTYEYEIQEYDAINMRLVQIPDSTYMEIREKDEPKVSNI